MPTYTYETIADDATGTLRRFEIVQGMNDAPLTHDPVSGAPVRRVITGGIGMIDKDRQARIEASCETAASGGACCGGGCGLM